MTEDFRLVIDLSVVLGAAAVGGVLAALLRQPILLGYLWPVCWSSTTGRTPQGSTSSGRFGTTGGGLFALCPRGELLPR